MKGAAVIHISRYLKQIFFFFLTQTEAVTQIKQVPSFVHHSLEKGLKLYQKTQHAESHATAWLSPGAALCCPVCLRTSSRWFSTSIHFLPPSPTNKPSFFLSPLQPRKPSILHPTQSPFPRLLNFSFCLLNTPPQTSLISPHGLITCLQPLQCNWLHKTY